MSTNTSKTVASLEKADNDVLTESELAAEWRVETRTIRLWRKTRGLPYFQLSRKTIRLRRGISNEWFDKTRTVTN